MSTNPAIGPDGAYRIEESLKQERAEIHIPLIKRGCRHKFGNRHIETGVLPFVNENPDKQYTAHYDNSVVSKLTDAIVGGASESKSDYKVLLQNNICFELVSAVCLDKRLGKYLEWFRGLDNHHRPPGSQGWVWLMEIVEMVKSRQANGSLGFGFLDPSLLAPVHYLSYLSIDGEPNAPNSKIRLHRYGLFDGRAINKSVRESFSSMPLASTFETKDDKTGAEWRSIAVFPKWSKYGDNPEYCIWQKELGFINGQTFLDGQHGLLD